MFKRGICGFQDFLFVLWTFFHGLLIVGGAYGEESIAVVQPTLRIVEENGTYRVKVCLGDQTLLSSPSEGLWSIATEWRNGWCEGWVHANPGRTERSGEWTVLTGTLELPEGKWKLQDAYRERGRAIECIRRFTWTGTRVLKRCTLSVRWSAHSRHAEVLLPGILYHFHLAPPQSFAAFWK